MFTFTFLINLALIVFLALTLNYISYQTFIIYIKKIKFEGQKIEMFHKTHKGNFFSFLVMGMSIVTIFYTQPTSYTVSISKSIAMFGPFTVFLIGLIMFSANILFNIKLIKKLHKLNLDKI